MIIINLYVCYVRTLVKTAHLYIYVPYVYLQELIDFLFLHVYAQMAIMKISIIFVKNVLKNALNAVIYKPVLSVMLCLIITEI